jgi:nucleotide-binding universal stress UspA family protein
LLIAYDGSAGSEAALHDLPRAGLPKHVEAVVLMAVDAWLPPPEETPSATVPAFVEAAHARVRQVLADARQTAEQAAQQVQELCPGWQVRGTAVAESPAWAIIEAAEQIPADLIVIGSRGHGPLDRLLLGSVSQTVVAEAPCSVRVARHGAGQDATGPVRVLVGIDGSAASDIVVRQVAARAWPADSELRIVIVLDEALQATAAHPLSPLGTESSDQHEDHEGWAAAMAGSAAQHLRSADHRVSTMVLTGDPKARLLEEARDWSADCIVVGARGIRHRDRFVLGSVAAAVAARATCSVEIVRPPRAASSSDTAEAGQAGS